MATIDVQVTGQREIVAALQRVVDVLGAHGMQTMKTIGEALKTGIDDEFDTSGQGEWQGLSETAIESRLDGSNGMNGDKPLVRSGRLRRSFQIRSDTHGVSVGTNIKYAEKHQFGTSERQVWKNRPSKSGRTFSVSGLPARPFLVVRDDTAREIVATVEKRIAAAWDDRAPRSV